MKVTGSKLTPVQDMAARFLSEVEAHLDTMPIEGLGDCPRSKAIAVGTFALQLITSATAERGGDQLAGVEATGESFGVLMAQIAPANRPMATAVFGRAMRDAGEMVDRERAEVAKAQAASAGRA